LVSPKITDKTLQRWAANNKSPKHALARLELDKAGTKLFEKAKFVDWVAFMTKRNPNNAGEAMMSTLMTRYSDDVLSTMIIAAKQAPNTKDIATKLQTEQLRVWASRGKPADEVFTRFNLKEKAQSLDDLVDDAQFAPWLKYVDDINGEDSKKANAMVAKTLTTYNEETNKGLYAMLSAAKNVESTKKLATDLQKGQLDNWLAQKVDVHDVSAWLGAKRTPLNSPERKAVASYRDALSKIGQV
ncbi:hypothetical protein JG688_00011699, partial [Phytophthora aleatoria]